MFHRTWVNNENGFFNTQYYINMANSSLGWISLLRPGEVLQNSESRLCKGEITGWEWLVGFTGFNLNVDIQGRYKHAISTVGIHFQNWISL